MIQLLSDTLGVLSLVAIPAVVVIIVVAGLVRKVNVYEAFIEGAKEGFAVGVKIIPYLAAMLVAIGVFRAGGAMEILAGFVSPVTSLLGMPAEALPLALMRPLSGSGSLGIMSELFTAHGPDSAIGRLASIMVGSGETTFYVLAVYFGAIGIVRTRHAVPAGIIADVAGLIAAVWVAGLLF